MLAIFLIAFAGSSLRSQSTGKPFNIGIQAEEFFSCSRLESQLTSIASLRASNLACVLLTRVVRVMRGLSPEQRDTNPKSKLNKIA
jgi:hypothetical protein